MSSPNLRTGGQVLVEALELHGVDNVFCVPGESFLAVLDALHDAKDAIRTLSCRQEGGAANMALMAEPDIDQDDMAIRGLVGGGMLLEGAVLALVASFESYDAYRDDLADEGLQISLGPGPGAGLALNGGW